MADSSCAVRSLTRASRLSLSARISASDLRRSVMSRLTPEDAVDPPLGVPKQGRGHLRGDDGPVLARLIDLADVVRWRIVAGLEGGECAAAGPR